MSVLGIGVDLVECARIQRSLDRFGEKFLRRVFTEGEIDYSMSMKFPARHLALCRKRSGGKGVRDGHR
jgi:holo-[acyl-carrier protein] synthase